MGWVIPIFLVGLGLLSIVLAIFLYYAASGVLEPEFVSAAVTSMLVFVTGISVFITLLILKEDQTARRKNVEPVFTLSTRTVSHGSYDIIIKNIGNGPAQNIDIAVSAHPSGTTSSIYRKNIRPGEEILQMSSDLGIGLKADFNQVDYISIDGKCTDIYGNTVPISDKYDTSKISTKTMDSLLKSDEELLREEINNINKSVSFPLDDFDTDSINAFFKLKNSQMIISCLQKNGPLTAKELCEHLGVSYIHLFGILHELEQSGAIRYEGEEIEGDTKITISYDN